MVLPMLQKLINKLRLNSAPINKDHAVGEERIISHQTTLGHHRAFRELSLDIHESIIAIIGEYAGDTSSTRLLEIGSGVIPFTATDPSSISSDLVFNRSLDCQFDVTAIPAMSGSIRAVVAQNVFHHITNIDGALSEMERVIEPNGLIVLVEPNHNWFSRIIYPKLFDIEGYDCDGISGKQLRSKNNEEVPNQAMSFIVFEREVNQFKSKFPNLEIVLTKPLPSGIRYIGTGGLNFKQLLPSAALRILRKLECTSKINWLLNWFSIHWIIVIQVKPNNQGI